MKCRSQQLKFSFDWLFIWLDWSGSKLLPICYISWNLIIRKGFYSQNQKKFRVVCSSWRYEMLKDKPKTKSLSTVYLYLEVPEYYLWFSLINRLWIEKGEQIVFILAETIIFKFRILNSPVQAIWVIWSLPCLKR